MKLSVWQKINFKISSKMLFKIASKLENTDFTITGNGWAGSANLNDFEVAALLLFNLSRSNDIRKTSEI